MFFKKNKNSQPAATVHQSTLGVSEISDDDLIAVTGGAGSSKASSSATTSSGSSVSGAAWSISSAAASTSSTIGATVTSSIFGSIGAGKRNPFLNLKLPS